MSGSLAVSGHGRTTASAADVVLSVEDLRVWFDTPMGISKAVDGVSFSVSEGDILAVVGESGSGKSVTMLSIVGLLGRTQSRRSGKILVEGIDVSALSERDLRMLRGRRVALMLQNPRASLDPSYTIGSQIVETLMAHGLASDRADAKRQAMVLLAQMDFDDIERVFRSYRHQLSGGMCQRALLALTLACAPRILIVDEPTASLDMAVRGQIIALLRSLNETTGLPILIITHDIGVVESIASRMLVMYAGHVQEEGDCETLLKRPLHPYTQALLGAVATPDHPKGALRQIMGEAPILTLEMLGCRFADRCDFVMDICRKNLPSLVEVFPGHRVRCHLHLINEENAS